MTVSPSRDVSALISTIATPNGTLTTASATSTGRAHPRRRRAPRTTAASSAAEHERVRLPTSATVTSARHHSAPTTARAACSGLRRRR